MTAAALPICDQPDVVFEELVEEIRHAITNHPRTLQKRIGPSEIGEPCSRALIAKLMGEPEPEEPPNWRATVGTAIHGWLEETFGRSVLQGGQDGPRFLLEKRVTVGTIGGARITGSCDLFDVPTGCVWDWKTKSKTQMSKHKRHGPGEKYRVQFHLYGYGMAAAGHRVTSVGMVCLPRDGEFSDIFHWAEPYDPQVAVNAIARANQLHTLASTFGVQAAQQMYPACDEPYCRTCGNYRSPFGAPKQVASNTAELFSA